METKNEYRFAKIEQIVFGRRDFDAQLEILAGLSEATGDRRPVEVKVQCAMHPASGMIVMYEDGLLVFACHTCNRFVGQSEVDEQPRPWGAGRGLAH